MEIKHPYRIALASIVIAGLFDFLFWQKTPGISFPIFILTAAAAGLLLAWSERFRIPASSLWLLLPTLFFAGMTAFRLEPFTTMVNVLLTLASLGLLALTLRGGRWTVYSLGDYVAGGFRLAGSTLSRAAIFWVEKRRRDRENSVETAPSQKIPWRKSAPVFRGLLLAVPVVAVFAALLSAADPVFARLVENVFNFSWLRSIDEILFRIAYVVVFAYAFMGIYLHGLTASQDERLLGIEKSWVPVFLGWTESAIVLVCVDLLFVAFVTIQFRYFFGGQTNINLEGFTYADYARRGFGELVTVALFSLFLFLGLSSITRREGSRQQRIFSILGVVLVLLVAVILVSAFQRLSLYENAYGFTRLRTYTHIFMLWLGLLLVSAAVLETVRYQRGLALAALLIVFGFGATLNIMNVDTFIVRQNVARAERHASLDASYLLGLSGDAVEPQVRSFLDPDLAPHLKDRLGVALACRTVLTRSDPQPVTWQSYHPVRSRVDVLMQDIQEELKPYKPRQDENAAWFVDLNGEKVYCHAPEMYD